MTSYAIKLTIPMIMAIDDSFSTVSFTGKPTLDLHTSILGKIKENCVEGNNYKEGSLNLSEAEFAHLKDCVNTIVNTKIPGKLALGYSAMLSAITALSPKITDEKPA